LSEEREEQKMATKNEMLQRMRRQYRDETGQKELDHHDVARFLIKKGWRVPKPKDPVDILAKELSDAARAEERIDRKTGLPYRANLCYAVPQGTNQLTLWVDTDEATRLQMQKAATKHRDQMVGEAYRLVLTVEHWNRINPREEPIQVPLDLQPDVEWMRNAPGEDEKTG
jgi:hypothetical protein